MASLSLNGCLKEAEEAVTEAASNGVTPLSFAGLKSAEAISDRRVMLSWDKATGGSGSYVYTIYRDRNFISPIATTADTSFLVSGLTAGTTYNFIVRASDANEEEKNNVVRFVTTLSQPSPDFNGIKALNAAPGLDGETKLVATWDPAIPPTGRTIGYYNIYLATVENGHDFSSPSFQTTGTSFTISGLTSGQRYWVIVRAEDDLGSEEKNRVKRSATTALSQTIAFAGLSSATPAAGDLAFSTINLSWAPATGSFNEYRVYMSTVSGAQNFAVANKIISPFFTGGQLTGIDGVLANTTYYIVVRACNNITSECDNNTVQRSVTTSPPPPSFLGVTSATLPSGADGMSRVNLSWNQASGVFNKYKIFIRYPSGPGPSTFDFSMNGSNTDYAFFLLEASSSATSVQVTGLTINVPVCFAVRAVYSSGSNFLADTQSPIAERCATPTLAPPSFAGASGATGGNTAYASTISWTTAGGVFDEYRVFVGDSAAKVRSIADNPAESCPAIAPTCRFIVTNSSALNYTYSPVAPNTTYYYLVRARYSVTGVTDGNNVVVTDTGGPATATHGGWLNLQALGDTYSKQTGLIHNARVTLEWNAFTTSAGTITSYNVYRSTSPGTMDFSSPYATGISASSRTFTDTSVTPHQTYYYAVRPVVGAGAPPSVTYAADLIKVIVPPDNMALVHRWIVNQDICGIMGRTTDPANNFRCPYTGPMNVGGYYDIQKSFFVDQFEMGCNYTPGPTGCGLTHGCYTRHGAAGAPAVNASFGVTGDVAFEANWGNIGYCGIKTSSSTWTSAGTSWLSSDQRRALSTNAAHAPPLAHIGQENAWETCRSHEVPPFGKKKLPSRRHITAFMQWHPSLNQTARSNLIGGSGMATAKACNTTSSAAHGLAVSNTWPPTTLTATMPQTSVWGGQLLWTGSEETSNCKSRYGIQDGYGNGLGTEYAAEYCTSLVHTSSSPFSRCAGTMQSYDPLINDFSGLNFDGVSFPKGTAAQPWDFRMTFGVTSVNLDVNRVVLPLGLPVVSSNNSLDAIEWGSGPGQIPTGHFNSEILYNNHSAGLYTNVALSWGGRYQGGFHPGRELFRCILDAE